MKRFIPGIFIFLLYCSSQSTVKSSTQKELAPKSTSYLGILYTKAPRGVIVVDIFQNSPAERAELAIGDVILSLNGHFIAGIYTMKAEIQAMSPGSEVILEVIKKDSDGQIQKVKAVLEETPDPIPPGIHK